MVNLLLKDLRVARIYLWLIAAVFLLASLQSLPADEVFFWLSVVLAAALIVVVPVVEWYLDGDSLISSLPVRRSTIVGARYVAAALAGMGALVAWVGVGYLLTPLLDATRTTAPMWATFDGVVTFVAVVGGLTAIFLPLYFRFGLGRGAAVFGFVCLTLLIGFGALTRGALLLDGSSDASLLTPPAQLLRGAISGLRSSVGTGQTVALVLAGVGGMAIASAWLAARGFEHRDL